MALVWAFGYPVRLLENKNSHGIEPKENRSKPCQAVGLEFGGLTDIVPVLAEPRVDILETGLEVCMWFIL